MTEELRQERIESLLREEIEEKMYKKMIKNMFCLEYAYAVKSKISNLFVCVGCETGVGNQMGHMCVELTQEEILEVYFEDALEKTNHSDIVKTWTRNIMKLPFPALLLQRLISNDKYQDVDYIHSHYASKIKKYIRNINNYNLTVFV